MLTNIVIIVPFAHGGFCNVFKGEHDGKEVAIKRFVNDQSK
jgi:hypothetical protein